MERLFRCQLEATSSSLWIMSRILAMLKLDGFNPSTPGLFDTAIASVSASLAFQVRPAASGSAFLRSKRRESLLAHWKVPIPKPQKRALVVTPGSVSGLFDELLLDSMAAQVKEDSLVFSSLAVSKALSSRSGSKPLAMSSSPLAGPSGYRPSRPAQRSGKCSASSSYSGGRRRFKSGKRSAPSSNPLGFRKLVPSPCLTLSGGCLSLHWQAWRDRGPDPWVGRSSGRGIAYPSSGLLLCLRNPSPCLRMPLLPSKGLLLRRSPWRWLPRVLWSLLFFPLPAFTATCLWFGRPRGRGVRSSACPCSIALWTFHTFAWRPSSLFSCQSDRGIGWSASIFGRRIFRFLCIRNLVASYALWAHGRAYQFNALCFGLSTAPQVFTRVMAPVSVVLHSLGIHMRRSLDDWLVQASSREALLRDLGVVLSLCRELGIVVNPEMSNFSPSQMVQYLRVVIDARTFMTYPLPDRISRLRSTSDEFLSFAAPPASLWQSLLGMLSSLSHLVPGGHLQMRSLQICLHRSWDRLDPSAPVPWSPDCLRDLRWWLRGDRFSRGVCLLQVSPDLDFWSEASDVG